MRAFSIVLSRVVVTIFPIAVMLLPSVCQAAPAPVVVVMAESRELTPLVQVAGTVISRSDTRLAAQVEGQVNWVADIGTLLTEGDSAAQLDDVLLRAVLAEEEAQVIREQANVTFQQKESQRLEKLARDNNAALSHLDQAKRDLSVAHSELKVSRSRVAQTREKLARTTVRTPFAGVVTEQFIQAGEWASPGTAVVRLVDTEPLEVQAWIPMTALPYIRKNITLDMTVSGRPASGIVRTLVPVGNDQSRLFELRLTPGDDGLSAGESVRIAVPAAESYKATVVPRDALIVRRDGISIFRILDNNMAERVKVTTGMAEGGLIEVHGDIKPGDRVVIRGGERLRAEQEVEVRERVPDE